MDELLRQIVDTINAMENSKNTDEKSLNFTHLRKLSNYCYQSLMLNSDNEKTYLIFFLYQYIDNLIVNFWGDTVYNEEVQISKTEIYNVILSSLTELKLNFKDDTKIYQIMNLLIKVYYKQVYFLNKNINE